MAAVRHSIFISSRRHDSPYRGEIIRNLCHSTNACLFVPANQTRHRTEPGCRVLKSSLRYSLADATTDSSAIRIVPERHCILKRLCHELFFSNKVNVDLLICFAKLQKKKKIYQKSTSEIKFKSF
jgi:hypothetical protein